MSDGEALFLACHEAGEPCAVEDAIGHAIPQFRRTSAIDTSMVGLAARREPIARAETAWAG